jgi:hypothetical protein
LRVGLIKRSHHRGRKDTIFAMPGSEGISKRVEKGFEMESSVGFQLSTDLTN